MARGQASTNPFKPKPKNDAVLSLALPVHIGLKRSINYHSNVPIQPSSSLLLYPLPIQPFKCIDQPFSSLSLSLSLSLSNSDGGLMGSKCYRFYQYGLSSLFSLLGLCDAAWVCHALCWLSPSQERHEHHAHQCGRRRRRQHLLLLLWLRLCLWLWRRLQPLHWHRLFRSQRHP